MNAQVANAQITGLTRYYEWLFYRCYRYSKKADSKWSLHWAIASVYVQIIVTMNLGVVLFLFFFIFKDQLGPPGPTPKGMILGVSALISVLHMAFLWHRGRYKRIIKKFAVETIEQEQRGDRLFGWYLVGSLFSLLAMFAIAIALLGLH